MLYDGEQVNPFRYDEPVPPEELIDRDEEAEVLARRAFGGQNSRLAAPRRFGKTSLLHRVLAQTRAERWAAVYVNFFGVLTLADVAERIELAYAEQLRGGPAAWFASVRRTLSPTLQLGGGPIPAGVQVGADPQAQPPLLERLALPRRLFERRGVRTLVVFDEFQDVLAAGDRTDAVLRSEIERHGDAASYVFSGSHVGMMRELFADKRRAFYAQAAPLELPPLSPLDVGEHVDARFRATGREVGRALGLLHDATLGHPQRTMLLAHHLWAATPHGGEADEETWAVAWDRALREVGAELRAAWTALAPSQRRVLAAVGENTRSLYAGGRVHGGSRGGGIVNALRVLVDRGDVVEDPGTPTGHRVVDPLLAAWIREGRPAD